MRCPTASNRTGSLSTLSAHEMKACPCRAAQISQISAAKQAGFAVAYVLGYGLQLFWFSKIAKGALKVLKAPGTKKM